MTNEKLKKANELNEEIKKIESLLERLEPYRELVIANKGKYAKLYTRIIGANKDYLHELVLPDCVRIEVKRCMQNYLIDLKKEYEEL